jgi:hypothetical protein
MRQCSEEILVPFLQLCDAGGRLFKLLTVVLAVPSPASRRRSAAGIFPIFFLFTYAELKFTGESGTTYDNPVPVPAGSLEPGRSQ